MPKSKNRTTSDLRTVRELLNQSARKDVMPSTSAALRFAALPLGGELLADTTNPLTDRQWGAIAALLGPRPQRREH